MADAVVSKSPRTICRGVHEGEPSCPRVLDKSSFVQKLRFARVAASLPGTLRRLNLTCFGNRSFFRGIELIVDPEVIAKEARAALPLSKAAIRRIRSSAAADSY